MCPDSPELENLREVEERGRGNLYSLKKSARKEERREESNNDKSRPGCGGESKARCADRDFVMKVEVTYLSDPMLTAHDTFRGS